MPSTSASQKAALYHYYHVLFIWRTVRPLSNPMASAKTKATTVQSHPHLLKPLSLDQLALERRLSLSFSMRHLKKGSSARSFRTFRAWVVFNTILQLAEGQLVLKNIFFLVSGDFLTAEETVIGFQILRHLRIDSCTLLKTHCAQLDSVNDTPLRYPVSRSLGTPRILWAARAEYAGKFVMQLFTTIISVRQYHLETVPA